MTRKELIEGMARTGRTAFVRASNPAKYWANLDESARQCEQRQAEAVLDFLTKETREGVSGWGNASDNTRRELGVDKADNWDAVFAYDVDGFRGTRDFNRKAGLSTPVQFLVLDLPEAPSASKRAAEALRSQARWMDGAIVCNARIGGRNTDDLRALADELEKEADK